MRARERRFLAEGPQAVREGLTVPAGVVEVYATAAAAARHPELRDRAEAAGVDWLLVDDDVVDAVAGTVHPQGVVAVCGFLDVPLEEALAGSPRLVAVGVDVRDPGNAGTLLRCADAAGAGAVVLAGDAVDPYNAKAVRASAGSLFHLPVSVGAEPAAVVRLARSAGLQVLAADGGADLDLDAAEDAGLLARPTAWLFGNEARGLPDALRTDADAAVAVPLLGRAESLNLGAAAAVCLYASARAHRRDAADREGTSHAGH